MNYRHLLDLIERDKGAAFRQIGEALNEDPNDVHLIALYAQLFQREDNIGLAYNLWKRVLQLETKPPDGVFSNLGLCAGWVKTPEYQEEAERSIRKAIKINPKNTASINNLALIVLHNGDYEQCMRLCAQSLEIDPNQPEVYETRAYCYLMFGEWEKGWSDWEHSVGNKIRTLNWPHGNDLPYWNGEDGSLLLRAEQGIGDEISFASVLPDLKDRKVTLECDHRLEGLFRRSFPHVDVHGTRFRGDRSWYRPHDYRALLGSLCRHYRNKAEDFPGTPYLVADPERRVQWRALLDQFPGKKIGIAWTGGKANTFADRRSFRLEDWYPILDKPHTFISLQYRGPEQEIAAMKATHGIDIKDWARATRGEDYDETAALVSECDLVISATTAIVHLCGALGKECWVLAPRKARWFYGHEGSSIPWYKSVRIFRQTKQGWPVDEIASLL